MRRVPYALALLAALVVSTPSHATPCPLVTDDAGDGRWALAPVVSSPQLDVLSADIASGTNDVVVVLRLASLAPDPVTTAGVRWAVAWRFSPTDPHYVSITRTATGTYTAQSTVVPVSFAVDVPAATMTWTVPRSAFAALATPGATFERIVASTTFSSGNADAASTMDTYVDQSAGCIPAT